MTRNENNGHRKTVPREYDRASGEYRPVPSRTDSGGAGQHARYATQAGRAALRRRRRKRALLCFYLFTFLAVVTAAVVLSLTVLFKIESIQVNGTSRYSSEQIIGASGIKTGENLFLAKTGQAARNIEQKLPYLASASVSRKIPAQIVITVQEAKPAGAMKYEGKYAVLATDGKVMELDDQIPENCPSVKGVKLSGAEPGKTITFADSTQKNIYENLVSAIVQTGFEKITQLDLTQAYKIQITYDNRIVMNLGSGSDFIYKLRFGKTILDQQGIKQEEKGVLNLSIVTENNRGYFYPDYSAASSAASSASSAADSASAPASSPASGSAGSSASSSAGKAASSKAASSRASSSKAASSQTVSGRASQKSSP